MSKHFRLSSVFLVLFRTDLPQCAWGRRRRISWSDWMDTLKCTTRLFKALLLKDLFLPPCINCSSSCLIEVTTKRMLSKNFAGIYLCFVKTVAIMQWSQQLQHRVPQHTRPLWGAGRSVHISKSRAGIAKQFKNYKMQCNCKPKG